MLQEIEMLDEFRKKYKNRILGRSKLWQFQDEIKILLEDGFSIAAIYDYLRDYRQIKYKRDYFYVFMNRNKEKILNSKTKFKAEELYTKKEEIKQQQLQPSTPSQEQRPKNKFATTTKNQEKEEKIITTPGNRKKEFKRYLYHWDKQPSNYLQYEEDKLNEKNFNAVMNKLIEEKLVTNFEFIENEFKEPYQPEHICGYMSTCRDKLKDNDNFKAFTPAMYKYYMEDNFFAKPPPEKL